MKSLANDRRITDHLEESTHNSKAAETTSQRKLAELVEANTQCERAMQILEGEIASLTKENEALGEEIEKKKVELEAAKAELGEEEEQKDENEEQHDMNEWIQEVQTYTGCPQEVIDGLIALEYEGSPDQQEICLSCYQQMKAGSQCKYLPCSHIFHVECIDAHLKVNTLCPGCGEAVAM